MNEPDDSLVAAEIARAARFQAVQLGIDLDADLRENRPLKAIYDGFQADANAAIREFAVADIGDAKIVMSLQARVYRAFRAAQTIHAIRQAAKVAEAELHAEDRVEGTYERND